MASHTAGNQGIRKPRRGPQRKTNTAEVEPAKLPVHDTAGIPPSTGTKPIDRWLTLASLAVAIALFLLPKTPLTVIACLLAIFALLIHPGWNLWWVADRRWRQLTSVGVLSCSLAALGYVSWPTIVSLKEVADFAGGIVVSMSDRDEFKAAKEPMNMHRTYSGTGFFVRSDWSVATCSNVLSDVADPTILITGPISSEKSSLIMGSYSSSSIILSRDAPGGVALLRLESKTVFGPHDVVFGRQIVPRFQYDLPKIDQRVFTYAVADGSTPPSFSTFEGRITRVAGGNLASGVSYFSTLPFRHSYCGAPVLNESMSVIGLLLGSTGDGDSEIIPIDYVRRAMEKVGLRMDSGAKLTAKEVN